MHLQTPSQSLNGRARADHAFLGAELHLLTAHAQLILFCRLDNAVLNC